MNKQVINKQTLGSFLNKSDAFLEQTLGKRKAEFVSNLLRRPMDRNR